MPTSYSMRSWLPTRFPVCVTMLLRELGENTRGPAPLSKQDRSRFLSALDTALQAALREVAGS